MLSVSSVSMCVNIVNVAVIKDSSSSNILSFFSYVSLNHSMDEVVC